MRRWRVAATALALTAAVPAAAGIASVSPPVPETAASQIFGRSQVAGSPQSVDLRAGGYVEREYFISGTADSYKHSADNSLAVLRADIPYTTRIIVRMPRDARKFSGVVHFEPIHPQQGGQSNWFATASYIMRSGDAYVSASLGDDVGTRVGSAKGPAPLAQSQVLHWFDKARYAAIDWPDEDGIRWQVMADIGAMLRSNRADNPLRGWPVKRMFVEGWSFTGSVQRVFINEGFHDRARLRNGKPVFDGYLVGISSRWNGGGYIPLSSAEDAAPIGDPRRVWRKIDVPVIELMTEFEAGTGPGPQLGDSDAKVGAHRLYQLGGVVHGESLNDVAVGRTGRPNLAQLAAKNYPFAALSTEARGQGGCPVPISDLPHGAFARAAIDNLKRWSLDGVPPPHAAPLTTDAKGTILRDEAGNPAGGLRAAELDLPLARYGLYEGSDHPECRASGGRPMFVRNELSAAALKARYGDAASYLRRYNAATDALVAARWLLPADGVRLKQKAAREAAADFAR